MKHITLIFLVFFSSIAFADTLSSEGETKKIADSLIDAFMKEQFSDALDEVKPYWPIPEVEVDGMANRIETQWPIIAKRFGKATGSEYLGMQRIGESFIKYVYLHKFENHAIYWEITFYKPKNAWLINKITFQDSLELLFI